MTGPLTAVDESELTDAALDGSAEQLSAGPVPEDELTGALEAILLVVDSPAAEEALAAAVGYPAERVRAELQAIAEPAGRGADRGSRCARSAAAGGSTPETGSRRWSSGSCSTAAGPAVAEPRWRRWR